jgi:hypothetical protein
MAMNRLMLVDKSAYVHGAATADLDADVVHVDRQFDVLASVSQFDPVAL